MRVRDNDGHILESNNKALLRIWKKSGFQEVKEEATKENELEKESDNPGTKPADDTTATLGVIPEPSSGETTEETVKKTRRTKKGE